MLTSTPEAPTRANFQKRPADGTYQNRLQYVGQVVEALSQGRLRDPGVAGPEVEGRLDHLQLGGAHQDLQQDLEPRRPELDARDRLVLYEEEARHRVAGLARLLEEDLGEVLAPHGDGPPQPRPRARRSCRPAA